MIEISTSQAKLVLEMIKYFEGKSLVYDRHAKVKMDPEFADLKEHLEECSSNDEEETE